MELTWAEGAGRWMAVGLAVAVARIGAALRSRVVAVRVRRQEGSGGRSWR